MTTPDRRRVLGLMGAALALPAQAACSPAPTDVPAAAPPAAAQGLDRDLVLRALERAGALPQLRALIVSRRGGPLVERVFSGPGLDAPVNIKSASKTVLAAIAGAALDRQVLPGLDAPMLPLLGRAPPQGADPRLAAITVEHLLALRAGLESTSGRNYGRWVTSRDWVGFALGRPFVDDPGGRMIYSTGTSHITSALLTRAAGRDTRRLAQAWLGDLLDIRFPEWPRDPQGIYFGGNDMLMSPRALMRFGEMAMAGGTYAGTRVLSESFLEAAWRPQGVSPFTGHVYGLGWWMRRSGRHQLRFAWGYGGQMLFLAPSLQTVAVMTSDPTARGRDGHVQALHAIVDECLVPAAERGGDFA